MIKTGILCIPTYDEAAVQAVRRVLALIDGPFVLLADQHVTMQRYVVEDLLRRWCDEDELDFVMTIGGTLPAPGPSGRELVPEATLAVAERLLPGLPETMRALACEQSPLALLDRSVAAIRGRTVLLNLPAGAGPAALFLNAVVEVIPAIVRHLQDDPSAPQLADVLDDESAPQALADASDTGESPVHPHGLDPAEFAAFLQRSRGA